ncbi:hypothetical protein ABFS83_09G028800 [Erythranthe nasuta]
MVQAKTSAERGDLTFEVSVLKNCRRNLSETVSARAGDRLCAALDAELKKSRSEWRADKCTRLRGGLTYCLG